MRAKTKFNLLISFGVAFGTFAAIASWTWLVLVPQLQNLVMIYVLSTIVGILVAFYTTYLVLGIVIREE